MGGCSYSHNNLLCLFGRRLALCAFVHRTAFFVVLHLLFQLGSQSWSDDNTSKRVDSFVWREKVADKVGAGDTPHLCILSAILTRHAVARANSLFAGRHGRLVCRWKGEEEVSLQDPNYEATHEAKSCQSSLLFVPNQWRLAYDGQNERATYQVEEANCVSDLSNCVRFGTPAINEVET